MPEGAGYRNQERQPPRDEESDCSCHHNIEGTTINPLCPEHGHYAKEGSSGGNPPTAGGRVVPPTEKALLREEYREGRDHAKRGLPKETDVKRADEAYQAGYDSVAEKTTKPGKAAARGDWEDRQERIWAEREEHEPEDEDEKEEYWNQWRRHSAFGDEHVTRYVNWARENGHDPDHAATLKRYQRETPDVGKAHADFLADQLYIGGGERNWRSEAIREEHGLHSGTPGHYLHERFNPAGEKYAKTAQTDGRIVGHCDHCHAPVRWHTGSANEDGHLEHLHNGSHKCSDGGNAKTGGLVVLPQFFVPSFHTASEDLAIQPAGGAPNTGGGQGGAPGVPRPRPGASPNMSTTSMPGQVQAPGNPNDTPDAIAGGGTQVTSSHSRHPGPDPISPDLPAYQAIQTLQAPTPENPSGRSPDEYKANTWEGLVNQRPMQSAEQRHINTPVKPEGPAFKTRNINTPTTGWDDERDEDEDEEDEDED